MTALLLVVAVLAADLTAAEQKMIEKARKELAAARLKAGGPAVAKIETSKIELEAIDAAEIDLQMKQQMVRKSVKGDPVYKFRNEVFRKKERERVQNEINYAKRINPSSITPDLNLLRLKVGDKGRINLYVNGAWTGRVKEQEPLNGSTRAVLQVEPANSSQLIAVNIQVKGTEKIDAFGHYCCVVTGIKKERGQIVYHMLLIEQFDSRGNLIDS